MAALTPAQAEFAGQVGATRMIEPTEAAAPVFLYRNDELMTQRWLVDPGGKVLDTASFHTSPRSTDRPR